MPEITGIAEKAPTEVSEYLERFTSAGETDDRANIENFIQRFKFTALNNGRTGMLHAVGGSVNKELPRKDIDILVTLNKADEKSMSPNEEWFVKAQNRFKDFQTFISDVVKDSGFEIEEVRKPEPDSDYPSIPINDGSITIKGAEGTPIELIINPEEDILPDPQHPAIILTQIK